MIIEQLAVAVAGGPAVGGISAALQQSPVTNIKYPVASIQNQESITNA
ncbi:MAG: hypothetical protein ACE5OZ_26195 [Candidatus Heimdallarchaeota archaeon]